MKNTTFSHTLPPQTPAVQSGVFRLLEVKQGETKTINRLDSGFRDFIISNDSNQCTVADWIKTPSLCKTAFYAKLREEFGMTAKQWMLKQKMKLIEDMLADRRGRIKDNIIHFGFSSHEQFYTFWRRHFNCKPTELKMRANQLGS